MAEFKAFTEITDVGAEREKRQYRMELLIRFVVLRNFEYTSDVDVHKYLDRGIIALLNEPDFDWDMERKIFQRTMETLRTATGQDSFKVNKRFSLGKFEFATLGLSKLLETKRAVTIQVVTEKVEGISALPEAKKYSGAGVRGTQRLAKFVMPLAEPYFLN